MLQHYGAISLQTQLCKIFTVLLHVYNFFGIIFFEYIYFLNFILYITAAALDTHCSFTSDFW